MSQQAACVQQQNGRGAQADGIHEIDINEDRGQDMAQSNGNSQA
jgi:hypothetical protein